MLKLWPYSHAIIVALILFFMSPPNEWPYAIYYSVLDETKVERLVIDPEKARVLGFEFSLFARGGDNKKFLIEYEDKKIFIGKRYFRSQKSVRLQCRQDICYQNNTDAKLYMAVLVFMWGMLAFCYFNPMTQYWYRF